MQNHTLPTPLAALSQHRAYVSNESEARWARGEARACIVLVHGFGGRAVATWGDFAELALADPAFADADLVFLGYESRTRHASYNVGVLYAAIAALAERPTQVLATARGPTRPEDFTYETIILVGHSLGGALVRDVAMSAKQQAKPWADRLQLALFAPAHLGASAVGLAQMSIGVLRWGPVEAATLLRYPVLGDLKQGSPFIQRLVSLAEQIGVHSTTQARFVAQSPNDWVVCQDRFYQDPPSLPYPDTNHLTCCKAKPTFLQPVVDVAGVLP